MTYDSQQARQDLLDGIADAIEALASALGGLGGAYEQLDEQTADELEEQLFRPVQLAFGRARAAHSAFAQRNGLPTRDFAAGEPGARRGAAREYLNSAMESIGDADATLAELQDSMLPVEVGDAELRAGLADVRATVSELFGRADALTRTLGR